MDGYKWEGEWKAWIEIVKIFLYHVVSVAVKNFHVYAVFECFRLLLVIGLKCL